MPKVTRQPSGVVEGAVDESLRTQSDAATSTAVDSAMSRRKQVRRRVAAAKRVSAARKPKPAPRRGR